MPGGSNENFIQTAPSLRIEPVTSRTQVRSVTLEITFSVDDDEVI
jgi:hypothetical protein